MNSAVLTRVRDIQVQSLPRLQPKDKEVLIKVLACGICGTDVHIFEGDKGAADNPFPIVLGHEFAGVIEKAGKDVKGLKEGDRVCVDPNVMCGECEPCRNGQGHFCQQMVGIGTTVNGGFSQYCVVPYQQVYKLADNISMQEGAMAEPVACCLHGIDLCNIKAGGTVAVIGGGMIGLIMLQLARLRGAAKVILIEPVEIKRLKAIELGASMCISPQEDVQAKLLSAGINNIGTVIECVGKPETISLGIKLAGNGGEIMMFGLTKPDETIELMPFEVFKKELKITSSFINPYTIQRAVELINEKRIDVLSMISAKIPLSMLNEALGSTAYRTQGKCVVEPWQ